MSKHISLLFETMKNDFSFENEIVFKNYIKKDGG